MANALRVDVRQSSEQLVNVEFNFKDRHRRLHLVEESGGSIDCLRNKFLDEIQVNFILLESRQQSSGGIVRGFKSYAFAVGVVECLQLHNIGVSNNTHDLQLPVLYG